MGCSVTKWALLALLATATWGITQQAAAYSGEAHQQLMFIAGRQYNECVKNTPEWRLSALQVRYAAKAAVSQADASFLRRMFRWGFYEREQQSPKSTLWVVETRMHEHFNELTEQMASAETDAEQFSLAGRIAAYVQDVSSPVRVVPIYTARFWRFNTNDRFDNFDLHDAQIEAAMAATCDQLLNAGETGYSDILKATAEKSLRAIVEPIPGMPATWQSFWRLASDPAEFGEYGPAGNRFGTSTSFRCGDERCVLLNDDPLYREFASARHADAVLGTMRVLHSLQVRRLGEDSEVRAAALDLDEPAEQAGQSTGVAEAADELSGSSASVESTIARMRARSIATETE